MTSLHRVVVEWSGTCVVGRAVTVLHYSASDNSAPPVAAIATSFNAMHGILPVGVTITTPTSGDIINDVDGSLVGAWTAPSQPLVTGSGSFAPAAGVGACVGWSTGGIVVGKKGPRRLRGRTFVVPLSSGAYESNGTLIQGGLDQLNAFATQLLAAGPLAVWHRPNKTLSQPGNSYGVQSFKVRDKVAFLSSRRD